MPPIKLSKYKRKKLSEMKKADRDKQERYWVEKAR